MEEGMLKQMTKEEYFQEIDIIYNQFKKSNKSEWDHELLATKLMWLTIFYKEGTNNNMWKDEL